MTQDEVKKVIKKELGMIIINRESAYKMKLSNTQKSILENGTVATAKQESNLGLLSDKHSDPDDYGIFGLNINQWKWFVSSPALKELNLKTKYDVLDYIKKDSYNIKIGMWFYADKYFMILKYPTTKKWLPRSKKILSGEEVAIAAYSLYTKSKILPDNDFRIQGFKRKHNPPLNGVTLRH